MTDAPSASATAELYLITPEEIILDKFAGILAKMVAEVPVSCLQIRLAQTNTEALKKTVETLAPIAWEKDIAVLLCDHPGSDPDLTAGLIRELNLDGIHLETNTSAKSVKAVRKLMGTARSIGVSCRNSTHGAMLASEAGADYVSFGPLFHSPVKGMAAEKEVEECLHSWAVAMQIPCVAIGGITTDNVHTALATGAEFIAPVSDIWQHEDGPVSALRTFYQAIKDTGPRHGK